MSSPVRQILFVEDNPLDVEMTLATFEEQRITNPVVVVADGAEALDYLFARGAYQDCSDGPPMFVLLDLKMPRVDGLEVLRQMKADPRLRAIPVVMLTSSREEQDLVRSYRLGVNAYIVKPVGVAAFVDAVKQLGLFWAVHNSVPQPGPARAPAEEDATAP